MTVYHSGNAPDSGDSAAEPTDLSRRPVLEQLTPNPAAPRQPSGSVNAAKADPGDEAGTNAADAADAEAARALLVAHVPDQETGLCLVCYTPSPCRPANAAANRLVDLNEPLPPPEQTRPRRNGWRDWIWRPQHWRMPRAAPLITHAWRRRFATITPRPATANQRTATHLRPATNTSFGNTSPWPWHNTQPGKHRRQPTNAGRHRQAAYTGHVTRAAW